MKTYLYYFISFLIGSLLTMLTFKSLSHTKKIVNVTAVKTSPEKLIVPIEQEVKKKDAICGKWADFYAINKKDAGEATLVEIREDGTYSWVTLRFGLEGRPPEGAEVTRETQGTFDIKTGYVNLTQETKMMSVVYKRFYVKDGELRYEVDTVGVCGESMTFQKISNPND